LEHTNRSLVAESTAKFEVVDGDGIIDWLDSIWEDVSVAKSINSHGSVLNGLESQLLSCDRDPGDKSWSDLSLVTCTDRNKPMDQLWVELASGNGDNVWLTG
jgi:hypothetical protein